MLLDKPMEGLSVLSAMMAPVVLISACGLLLLGIYTKYSRVMESLRKLNTEQRALKYSNTSGHHPAHQVRLKQIDQEWVLLRRRLGSTLQQMQSTAAAAMLFLLASLLIAGAMLVHVRTIDAAVALVCIGVAALMVAMAQAVAEARMISRVIDAEDPRLSDKAVKEMTGDWAEFRTDVPQDDIGG